MTPADTETPANTRPELEEALARYTADAKAALEAGNILRWAKRHEQINDMLDNWRAVCLVDG